MFARPSKKNQPIQTGDELKVIDRKPPHYNAVQFFDVPDDPLILKETTKVRPPKNEV